MLFPMEEKVDWAGTKTSHKVGVPSKLIAQYFKE